MNDRSDPQRWIPIQQQSEESMPFFRVAPKALAIITRRMTKSMKQAAIAAEIALTRNFAAQFASDCNRVPKLGM